MTKRAVKKPKSEKLLTEVELEMMNILWAKGSATVADVQKCVTLQRKLAYTSVSTILRILEQKGVLQSRKEGRGHVYFPSLEKPDYETRSLRHLVTHVFGGEPAQLVQRLLDAGSLTEQELGDIKKMLQETEIS